MKYIRLWLSFAKIRLLQNLGQRWAGVFFISGKFLRFILIGLIILSIADQVELLQGYTKNELVIVYLVFNLLDMLAQFFFRGIYTFRNAILYGSFDGDLLKPIHPLFSALMTSVDFLDVPLFIFTLGLLINYIHYYSWAQIGIFGLLFANGFILVTGIHILVAAMAILFNTADQLIGIFRDLSAMARFPVDIYALPFRILLNTIIPIGIAYTLPAQVLFSQTAVWMLVYGLILGGIFFLGSLFVWQKALVRYSSASS